MKYFLLVVALIVAVVLAAMFVPIKDGKTLLDPDALKSAMTDLSGSPMSGEQADESDLPEAGGMYRWRDSSGGWQYGDRPPPGVQAEPVTLSRTQRMDALPTGSLNEE